MITMSKKSKQENYLENIPAHKHDIGWSKDENDIVTLEMKNRGLANVLAQKLLKKPKVSYIHLEEFGSFVWLQIDGKRDILTIGKMVKERFGEKAEPIYERLAQYINTLQSNGFVTIVK